MGRRSGGWKACVPRRWSADQYPYGDSAESGMIETWCGERKGHKRAEPFDSPRLATCLKCAQAIGKAKLGQLAGRVRLEKLEPLAYHKATYGLHLDGTLRGYVAIDNGWGEKWKLCRLGMARDQVGWTGTRPGSNVSGSVVDYFTAARGMPEGAIFWPVHFSSRDAMACAALAYYEKYGIGGLPTVEEGEAAEVARLETQRLERVARDEALAAAAVERGKREALRVERVEAWSMALEALEARADLSNVERAGLEAIKLLYPMG